MALPTPPVQNVRGKAFYSTSTDVKRVHCCMVHDLFKTVIRVYCNVLRCMNRTSPRQIALYISVSLASEHP